MKRLLSICPLLIIFLYPIAGFGFSLNVTHTNETCAGNGSVTFAVSNTDPNGSIVYVVYKLPDVTTPYASGTSTTVNGLSAGDYRIIAKETVGSVTTIEQQDVTITSSFTPLTYTVIPLNQACSNTSTISVIANTGTAATYEIIFGPTTFPPQTSNTFSGLAVGLYRIKVTDICGNSIVQAFTVTLNPTLLTVNNGIFSDTTPPSCNSVLATNTVSSAPGTVIGYPLNITYTLYLPGGNTSIIQTVLNSGDPTSQDFSQVFPFTNSIPYPYSIVITDACGTTYPGSNFIVNRSIVLSSSIIPLPCNKYYFQLNAYDYTGSYTLNFDTAPAGFNAGIFNSSYPGPYNQSPISFGSESQTVPFGDYKVTMTDMCGRTTFEEFSIVDKPPEPTIVGISNGCMRNDGRIVVTIANYKIVTAIITVAPSTYPFPLPHNVTSLISSDGSILIVNPVPLGDYTLVITDDCGDIIPPLDVTVPPFESQGITVDVLQGCEINMASAKIASKDSKLVSAKITAAPASYPFPLPHDVSNHIISSGEVYLTGLTSGNYTFTTLDECGITSSNSVAINGYAITSSTFSLVPDCGAFNIPLNFISNITETETFGLQKLLNPATNTWGNPVTESVYTDGTVPDATNSYLLTNNTTNLNLTFNGVFRIVHHYTSFNNGSDINNNIASSPVKDCIEILAPNLSFNGALAINDVYLIPCSSSGNFDVYVSATGIPPIHYTIVNGTSVVVDNGNSSVFTNLTQGIYQFEVEDNCGNSVNRTFDVSDLTSLVTIYPTCTLFNCVATITGNETFDLTAQNPVILGIQSSSEYTISYFTSQANADNNVSPITNLTNFNPTSNPQTIYVRMIFNQFPNCYQTASFDVMTGQTPRINLAPEYIVCDSQPVTLDASPGNLSSTTYSWSNGATTPSIVVSDVGITTVSITAENAYAASCNTIPFACSTSKDITVNIADIPQIDHIETHDWTDNQNSITVFTTNQTAFEYSLDGINFQTDPSFTHLLPGLYTVYVRDVGGCQTITQEVWLLIYPKFFTPNGDGYNETWFIKNSENEPDFKVDIFGRYGKLITRIVSNSPGWDGKLNGKLLFADDYWFAAYRQDGRILKGHFTLKR